VGEVTDGDGVEGVLDGEGMGEELDSRDEESGGRALDGGGGGMLDDEGRRLDGG